LAWRSSSFGRSRVTGPFAKVIGRLLDMPRSYTLAGSVDAVIVPGMGVLEETLGVRPWGLPFALYLMAAACRLRSRHFVLLDVGAEWAVNPITRRLYVATVDRATHVSYRDRSSAVAMARAGARDPEAIAPDLAFAHPAPTLAKPEPARIVVGVMAYYGLRDDPIRGADMRRKYVANLADAVAQFAGAGDQVVLVGGDRVDHQVACDVRAAVLTARAGLPEEAILVREITTFTDLTSEMMRADVVIASRFHNLVCALRLARPTISVGYAKKNRQLMRALGLHNYCQDIEQLDANRLVAQVQSARTDSDALTARIRQGTSNYAVEVDCLLDRVASEALGLQFRKRLEMNDEVDIWQNT
jgi:polysaccharide pyruvyl transferase WcaK-like protein